MCLIEYLIDPRKQPAEVAQSIREFTMITEDVQNIVAKVPDRAYNHSEEAKMLGHYIGMASPQNKHALNKARTEFAKISGIYHDTQSEEIQAAVQNASKVFQEVNRLFL